MAVSLTAHFLGETSGLHLSYVDSDSQRIVIPIPWQSSAGYLEWERELEKKVQPEDIGWPTGNGKKLSNSQACCLAQLCLAAA